MKGLGKDYLRFFAVFFFAVFFAAFFFAAMVKVTSLLYFFLHYFGENLACIFINFLYLNQA